MNGSKLFLAFSFMGLMFSALLSAQGQERITMIYQETVCPPQWISYESSQQTSANLQELLARDSINVYSFRITGKAGMACAGCQCLSGRNVEIIIDAKYQQKMEEYRFHRPWVWMEKNEFSCDWTMGLFDDEISDSLVNMGIRVQGLYCAGLSQQNDDCSKQSGRIFTLRVDKDDIDEARKEGFILKKGFKQW